MKTFEITYRDNGETHRHFCKALNASHAEEKFVDPDAGYTLEMISSTKRYFTEAEKIARKYKRSTVKPN